MPDGVRCLVEECVYNELRACTAKAIEIQSNGNDVVGTVKGTMCDTFHYKEHYRAQEGLNKEAYRDRFDEKH